MYICAFLVSVIMWLPSSEEKTFNKGGGFLCELAGAVTEKPYGRLLTETWIVDGDV